MRAIYAFCFAPASLEVEQALASGIDDCGWEDPVYLSAAAGLKVPAAIGLPSSAIISPDM